MATVARFYIGRAPLWLDFPVLFVRQTGSPSLWFLWLDRWEARYDRDGVSSFSWRTRRGRLWGLGGSFTPGECWRWSHAHAHVHSHSSTHFRHSFPYGNTPGNFGINLGFICIRNFLRFQWVFLLQHCMNYFSLDLSILDRRLRHVFC